MGIFPPSSLRLQVYKFTCLPAYKISFKTNYRYKSQLHNNNVIPQLTKRSTCIAIAVNSSIVNGQELDCLESALKLPFNHHGIIHSMQMSIERVTTAENQSFGGWRNGRANNIHSVELAVIDKLRRIAEGG